MRSLSEARITRVLQHLPGLASQQRSLQRLPIHRRLPVTRGSSTLIDDIGLSEQSFADLGPWMNVIEEVGIDSSRNCGRI